jgi:hypothetical protein
MGSFAAATHNAGGVAGAESTGDLICLFIRGVTVVDPCSGVDAANAIDEQDR